jgi:arsenical pump membrane protein
VSEALAVVALLAALAAAVARSRRAPEAVVALGGAAALVAAGVISWHGARTEAGDLAPTLARGVRIVMGGPSERVTRRAVTLVPHRGAQVIAQR